MAIPREECRGHVLDERSKPPVGITNLKFARGHAFRSPSPAPFKPHGSMLGLANAWRSASNE